MTTVYDISLKMMRHVTDLLNGTATGGSTTTLIDTMNVIQDNAYFERGTLWIHSGTHAGKVWQVTDHAGNTLTFATVTGAIAAGVRFSVARGVFPWEQIKGAIQQALDGQWVTGHDDSLTGDGVTAEFVLPSGVADIYAVKTEDANGEFNVENHWEERLGSLVFEKEFEPEDGEIIHIYYKGSHAEITDYSTEIHAEINERWLVLEAAKNLLMWAAGMYKNKPDLMIEERVNMILNTQKGKAARRGGPIVKMKTTGGG